MKRTKVRNIAVGVLVGGVAFAGGVAVAWQNGWSVRETMELGAGVIASKTSRHTIADRTAAILAKKPQLKGVAKSAGGKLREGDGHLAEPPCRNACWPFFHDAAL